MKLCNGIIIENELVLDSHVVVESRSDINYEDQNLVDEQNHPPISPCGKCVTCNCGYLKTDPVYSNKVAGNSSLSRTKWIAKPLVLYILLRVLNQTVLYSILGSLLTLLLIRRKCFYLATL